MEKLCITRKQNSGPLINISIQLNTYGAIRAQKHQLVVAYLDAMEQFVKCVHSYRLGICKLNDQPRSAMYFRLKKIKSKKSPVPYVYPILVLVIGRKRRVSRGIDRKQVVEWQVGRDLAKVKQHQYHNYLSQLEVDLFIWAVAHLAYMAKTYARLKADLDAQLIGDNWMNDMKKIPIYTIR